MGPEDIVLITGGSNGLGLDLIRELIEKRVKIINIDIESPPVEIKDRIVSFKCDLSNEEELLKLLKLIKLKMGIPTIIINNAAIRQNEKFENLSIHRIKQIIQVNTISILLILKFFLNKDKKCYVINISSVLGLISPSNLSIYSLTKSSIVSLHDTLTHEYKNSNVRFLLVLPGQLNTRLFNDVKPPKQFFAPVLNSLKLSKEILNKLEKGERGILFTPFYTNFIPILKFLPFTIYEILRWFSEMDSSIKEDTIIQH